MRVEPAVGKPATETKIVTLFLLGKKKGHPGNIFTKLKLLNVEDFLFMKIKIETIIRVDSKKIGQGVLSWSCLFGPN